MKVLIVSDIHANRVALQAVLASEPENVLCLGDLGNYGPQPDECIAWAAATLVPPGKSRLVGCQDADAQCSKPYVHLAKVTRPFVPAFRFSEVDQRPSKGG